MNALIEQLTLTLPDFFPGPSIDKLTANSLRWRTLQNRRSQGTIPENCFTKVSSRKVLILKAPFLTWLAEDILKPNSSSLTCNN